MAKAEEMTVRVCIQPTPESIAENNGVGRVVHAQYQYLPEYGIELVDQERADLIVCHITQGTMPRVDVLHTHGLYWTGDPNSGHYVKWHHEANSLILSAARRARAITVPSSWVAEPFKRDMRITPSVIGHGIDLEQWQHDYDHEGYILWNKNRAADVCDPTPAIKLARMGVPVVSTFGPAGIYAPNALKVIGLLPGDAMREVICKAQIYLATTKETFGIGTLEALAAGVPVLGYRWGGTADLVEHKVNGYLAEPGDVEDLRAGVDYIRAHWNALSASARDTAQHHTWDAVMMDYADLYNHIAQHATEEEQSVSVIITNYNYGRYVCDAVESVLRQTVPAKEIIIVDDGSTDDSLELLGRQSWVSSVHLVKQTNQGVAAARNNGIELANSPYIVCLDADDQLDPLFIEALLPALQNDRGVGIAYSGLGILQDDGTVRPNAWPPPFDWEAQATPNVPPSNCIPSACMFRRSMWERAGNIRQVYAPGEDTEFWTRGLSVGFTAVRVTDMPLFQYRLHEGSAHKTKPYRPIDTWHPWMRDKQYPMAAPSSSAPSVRSYSDPTVSIIIPCGTGHAKYLPAAIDSVLGQTVRSWELIIIDDSQEAELALNLPQCYPFIRVDTTIGKQGPAVARNAGVALARAPLVLFLDADDYLLPHALQMMLQTYSERNGSYVYSDWYRMDGSGEIVAHETNDYRQSAWLEHGQHAITALIAREHVELVEGFDENMSGWEDWDFFIKLAIAGVCGVRVPEPLLVYRHHTGTIRNASLEQKDQLLTTLRERYGAYATGDKDMCGCGAPGGAGAAIQAAKQAWDGMTQSADFVYEKPVQQIAPTTIRLRFTGDQVGAVPFRTPKGRNYRGGANVHDRFIDAHPEDVDWLLSSGAWAYVVQSATTCAPAAHEAAYQAVEEARL